MLNCEAMPINVIERTDFQGILYISVWSSGCITLSTTPLQAIQESLLPPSVHMYPKKKGKASEDFGTNGAVAEQNGQNNSISSLPHVPTEAEGQTNNAGDSNKSIVSIIPDKVVQSSSSPYPNVYSVSLSVVYRLSDDKFVVLKVTKAGFCPF